MPPRPRRPRTPTPDELRLWRDAMRDAVPLDPAARTPEPDAPPAPAPDAAAGPPARIPAPPPPPARAPPPPAQPGIDRHTSERLRKGRREIDARIDLHGMTQDQAHAALASFLQRCQHEDRRAVLVITGKGSVSAGGGVLRRAVPRWLSEPPLAGRVVGVETAAQRHGGDGACYVLLRRRHPRRGEDGA